jgi:hypothetical protein
LSEFERTKQNVGGRSILITSWYDDVKEHWYASAPAYTYLGLFTLDTPITCSSRQAAVKQVADQLAIYFQKVDASD